MLAKVINVQSARTIQDVLTLSGTDFTTELCVPEVEGIPVDGYRAIRRGDTGHVFGWTKGRYRTNDHRAQLQSIDDLVVSGDLRPVSVSVWDKGGLIAYQFEAPDLTMQVGRHDAVSPLLTLSFGNDGKVADRAFFSSFRFFCKNQLGKVGAISTGIRHGMTVYDRFADELMLSVMKLRGAMPEEFRQYANLATSDRPWSEGMTDEYFADVLQFDLQAARKSDDTRNQGLRHREGCWAAHALETPMSGHGAWSAFNAVTRYLTHTIGRSEGVRNQRAIFDNGDVNSRALTLALKAA